MNANFKGIISACITALLWGFLAIVMKVALDFADPITIVWFRFSVAALFLLAYYLTQKPQSVKAILKSFPLPLLFTALFLSYNYLGFVMGLDYTTPSTAQVVIQIGPILLALSGILIFKEKVNRLQLLGFAVATIGLVLFYYNQLQTFASPATYNIGFFWIVTAAISWTCYAILQKKLVTKYEPQLLNLFIYAIPCFLFIPAVDFQVFKELELWQWILLFILGLNTLVAYGFLALAFKYTQAYKVSIIVTLNPIITLTVMTLLYYVEVSWITGEQLSLLSGIGALLLIGGAIMAVFFSRKNKSKTKSDKLTRLEQK